MNFLTRKQILLFHEHMIDRYGGTYGIRDENLLDAALKAPFQNFGGIDFFPTIVDKAIRLCVGLVKNHPFYDGNKRIAALALLVTLEQNDIILKTNTAELASVILDLAANLIDIDDFTSWVRERLSEREEPPSF